MKKTLLIIAAVCFSFCVTDSTLAASSPRGKIPGGTACFTFTDKGYDFKFLVVTKSATPRVRMQTKPYKGYSVVGALSISDSDAVPIAGSGAVCKNSNDENVFKFNISGTVYNLFLGTHAFNGRGSWNLSTNTGEAHALVNTATGATEYSGELTMIPCNNFDFQ